MAGGSAWAGGSVVAGAGDGWLPSDNPKVTAKSNKGEKQGREKCCLLMDTGALGTRNDKEKTGSA